MHTKRLSIIDTLPMDQLDTRRAIHKSAIDIHDMDISENRKRVALTLYRTDAEYRDATIVDVSNGDIRIAETLGDNVMQVAFSADPQELFLVRDTQPPTTNADIERLTLSSNGYSTHVCGQYSFDGSWDTLDYDKPHNRMAIVRLGKQTILSFLDRDGQILGNQERLNQRRIGIIAAEGLEPQGENSIGIIGDDLNMQPAITSVTTDNIRTFHTTHTHKSALPIGKFPTSTSHFVDQNGITHMLVGTSNGVLYDIGNQPKHPQATPLYIPTPPPSTGNCNPNEIRSIDAYDGLIAFTTRRELKILNTTIRDAEGRCWTLANTKLTGDEGHATTRVFFTINGEILTANEDGLTLYKLS